MAMTRSKTIYGQNYGPLMPGVFEVDFPYCAQCSIAKASSGKYSFDDCCMDPVEKLELLLKRSTAGSDTAALFIEPVLGEGGYVPMPQGYLQKVREICDRENILLVMDEVQTGFWKDRKDVCYRTRKSPLSRSQCLVISPLHTSPTPDETSVWCEA